MSKDHWIPFVMKITNVTAKKIIVAKSVKTLDPNVVIMGTIMMAPTKPVNVSYMNEMFHKSICYWEPKSILSKSAILQ